MYCFNILINNIDYTELIKKKPCAALDKFLLANEAQKIKKIEHS